MKRNLFYIETFLDDRIVLDLTKVSYAKEYDEDRTEVFFNGMSEIINIKFGYFTEIWEHIYD